MERKRKLPARAAARVEHASKRRTSTPPADGRTTRSATPALSAAGGDDSSADSQPAQHALPKSIQAGKPLPTVEQAQPDDLSPADYQSFNESGVLAESLSRSRQKWVNEGIFERYWAKPSKRRGVAVDDPKNPPKDSMVKLGQVVIAVEPHVFEATMYGVKDPKPAASLPPNVRPIIMYGPSRGAMPPPPSPAAAAAVSTPPPPTPKMLSQSPAQTPTSMPATPNQKPAIPDTHGQPPQPLPQELPQAPPPVAAPPRPVPSPRGMEGILSPVAPPPAARPYVQPSPPLTAPSGLPSPAMGAPPLPGPGRPPAVARPHAPSPSPQASTPKAAPAHPPGTDSIIVTLAERATEDPQLRDLMKRVANGNAPKEELDRFQAIIDQITIETKRNGAAQGPSADRLFVDGRTVRFFAEEVRIILDIVLRTNPKQTSADLRPPAGSDPLVVLLVKTALDDVRVKDMVRRIGENRPQFSDATDLKTVLDRLKGQVAREKELERQRQQTAGPVALVPGSAAVVGSGPSSSAAKANGMANGSSGPRGSGPAAAAQPAGVVSSSASPAPGGNQPPVQQALRSKGPPPAPKVDVSAVVLEFAGGTGDRYLFPKYSILEYVPASAQGLAEVVASFLIVRKGSMAEYGGDPELDYYQPVTIRVQMAPQSSNQKLLDYLSRVVAPADEVKRYMDNIMGSMTRAEYVLLAMRLPRREAGAEAGEAGKTDMTGKHESNSHSHGPGNGHGNYSIVGVPPPVRGVLWTTTVTPSSHASRQQKSVKRIVDEDQQYQQLIASVTPKEVEEV